MNADLVQHHLQVSIGTCQVAVLTVQPRNENVIESDAKRETMIAIAIATAIQGERSIVIVAIETGVVTEKVIVIKLVMSPDETETEIGIGIGIGTEREIEVAIKTRATDIAHETMREVEIVIVIVTEAVTANEVQNVGTMIAEIPEMKAGVTTREMIAETTEETTAGMIEEVIGGTTSEMIGGMTEEMTDEMIPAMTDVMTDAIVEETETAAVTEIGVLVDVIETMFRLIAMYRDARSVKWCILRSWLVIAGDLLDV